MVADDSLNIASIHNLPSPRELHSRLPLTPDLKNSIQSHRNEIQNILFGSDPRTLIVVGPCSIHNTQAAYQYAQKLASLAQKVQDKFLLVMRTYFEKPRTSLGWKGLIFDPHLNQSYDIPAGLHLAREFLVKIIHLGLPTATELLDPFTPQYIADLICWSAIGARTTESQTHRQMASSLPMPLGFKNTTSGAVLPAIQAIKAASCPQRFFGIDLDSKACCIHSNGNTHCHLVLRGSNTKTNFQPEHIQEATTLLQKANLHPTIMVDCSHGNSQKNPNNQPTVFHSCIDQIAQGNSHIKALMLESNTLPGNQPFPQDLHKINPHTSITDPCIDWDTTQECILQAYQKLPSPALTLS